MSDVAKPKNVMLVDDTVDFLDANVRLLPKEFGCNVHAFDYSSRAIDYLRQNPGSIDIMLLDLMMPDMQGDELAKICRGIDPKIPIYIITGFSNEVARLEELKRQGIISGYLFKPLDYNRLRILLR